VLVWVSGDSRHRIIELLKNAFENSIFDRRGAASSSAVWEMIEWLWCGPEDCLESRGS